MFLYTPVCCAVPAAPVQGSALWRFCFVTFLLCDVSALWRFCSVTALVGSPVPAPSAFCFPSNCCSITRLSVCLSLRRTTRPPSGVRRRPPPRRAPCAWTGSWDTRPAMKTSETFEGRSWSDFWPVGCPASCCLVLKWLPLVSEGWEACRTARAATPAAATAARTRSIKQPRRRASSPPSDACLGRRRKAGPAVLGRTRRAKVQLFVFICHHLFHLFGLKWMCHVDMNEKAIHIPMWRHTSRNFVAGSHLVTTVAVALLWQH